MKGASTRNLGSTGRRARGPDPGSGSRARVSAARGRAPLPRRLAPRKQPRQERARDTVEAILRAAAHLIATRGYAGTNTNLVAERAGVSVGSLYQYFPHKDALVAALHARHAARVTEVVGHAMERLGDPAAPLARSLRELVDRLQAIHDADPDLARATSVQVPQLEAVERYHDAGTVPRVESILRARPEVRPGDRAVMAHVLSQATEAMTRWLEHDLPAGVDRAAATDEVTLLLTRYLER